MFLLDGPIANITICLKLEEMTSSSYTSNDSFEFVNTLVQALFARLHSWSFGIIRYIITNSSLVVVQREQRIHKDLI